jgi:hypothetical protein
MAAFAEAFAMTRDVSPAGESAYAAIEAAVMETSRGRWFLAEHARRNRHADTLMLLGAMARLEDVVRGDGARPRADLRAGLAEMAKAVADARREIADRGSIADAKVIQLLGFLEDRINALTADGAAAARAETPAGAADGRESEPVGESRPRSDPLALLAALTPEERIALFT